MCWYVHLYDGTISIFLHLRMRYCRSIPARTQELGSSLPVSAHCILPGVDEVNPTGLPVCGAWPFESVVLLMF